MRRCAVCLIAMLAVFGLARMACAASGSGDQGLNLHVPPVFWIGWDGDPNKHEGDPVYFELTEEEILGNQFVYRNDTDTLSAASNYKGTDLYAQWSDWHAQNGGTCYFDLWISWGTGWRKFPLSTSDKYIVKNKKGLDDDWDISYRLKGMSLEDDPDEYSTTITFTLEHP